MADNQGTPGSDDSFSDLFRNLPTPSRPEPLGAPEAAAGSRRALREARAAAEAAGAAESASEDRAEELFGRTQTPAEQPVAFAAEAETAASAPRSDLDDIFSRSAGEGAGTRKPRKRRGGCLVAVIVLLVIVAAMAVAGTWVWNNYGDRIMEELGWADAKDYEAGLEGDPVFVRIADGDSGCSISSMLFQAGVTKKSETLCDMLLETGENPNLYAGIFELQERMPAADALAILTDPTNLVVGAQLREQTLQHSIRALSTALTIELNQLPTELPAPFAAGGFIVGDREYFDAESMDREQIQTFFDEELPACEGAGCLKEATKSHLDMPANAFCAEMGAVSGQAVASILERIATACGINPKLLLLMLHEPLSFDLEQLAIQMTTSIVDGGLLISDADFFNASAMTEEEIQAFLDQKVPVCDDYFICLKDFSEDHPDRAADRYCARMPGGTNESAARIISKVATACGISPRVLLIMLEKEQRLVTLTNPDDLRFERAMGHACPDTGPDLTANCDPAFAGFAMQVYSAARQMQLYTAHPNSYHYRAGQVNTIQWHPSVACGDSRVYIQNQATANLYIYTPYRPNIAALAAGWGSGDDCSTYGNRNFYGLYIDWFAPERAPFLGPPTQIPTCTLPPAEEIRAANGTFTVATAELTAREAPSELCAREPVLLAQGAEVTVTAVYGAWSRASVADREMWLPSFALVAPE